MARKKKKEEERNIFMDDNVKKYIKHVGGKEWFKIWRTYKKEYLENTPEEERENNAEVYARFLLKKSDEYCGENP